MRMNINHLVTAMGLAVALTHCGPLKKGADRAPAASSSEVARDVNGAGGQAATATDAGMSTASGAAADTPTISGKDADKGGDHGGVATATVSNVGTATTTTTDTSTLTATDTATATATATDTAINTATRTSTTDTPLITDEAMLALTSQYCGQCHAGGHKAGGVTLASLEDLNNADTAKDSFEEISGGDMPTKRARNQLNDADKASMLAWLRTKF